MSPIITSLLGWALGPFWGKAAEWVDKATERSNKLAEVKLEAELIKIKAEAEVYSRKATSEIEWERQMALNMDSSWKDEWILILWSIPFIGAFIPWLQPFVRDGFIFLQNNAPDWYVSTWGVIVAATFAVRSALNAFDKWLARRGPPPPIPITPTATKAK